jgi:L-alanine-DL-glutamate epimerase-like enolase superfamily enzyme
MKITRLVFSRHRIDFQPAFRPSWDTRPRIDFTVDLVRVETDQGVTGIGAGYAVAGLGDYAELFVGLDPRDLERHFRIIDNISFHYGRFYPLDCALWDLYGKITGEPVWRLLGAGSGRVRCYASSGSLKSPEELAEIALRFRAEGFPAMKVRFQRPRWQDDIKALAGVRKAVGDDFLIMVDCNQGWRMAWDQAVPWTFKDALNVARHLEDLDAYWMEEPLHRGDYAGMRALRQATSVRIAGGELTKELHELRELVTTGCLDVLQPDCVCSGGITGLRKIATLAREHNIDFTPHTWGDGLGLVANAHLAAAAGSKYLEFPYDPPEWMPATRDFPFLEPIGVDRAGWLDLGEAPGMGMVLDEEKLKRTQIA